MKNILLVSLRSSFDIWIDSLNKLEQGLLTILFGVLFSLIFYPSYKQYRKEKYDLWKNMRSKEPYDFKKVLHGDLYMRTIAGIIMGVIIILFGLVLIVIYLIDWCKNF